MKKVLLVLSVALLSLTSYSQTYKVKGLKGLVFEFKQDTIAVTTKATGRVETPMKMTTNGDIRYYTASDDNFSQRYTVTETGLIIDVVDKFTGKTTSTMYLLKKI